MRRNRLAPVERLHDSVAALARRPDLFARFGVADTFEGRFESLTLHLALVLRRLADLPPPAADMAQDLTDFAFHRLDQGLREIGIGDMGVPKRMKGLAKHFYGRAAIYHAALASEDRQKLIEALRRNVFDGGNGNVEELAGWVAAVERYLAGLDLDNLLAHGLSGLEASLRKVEGPR